MIIFGRCRGKNGSFLLQWKKLNLINMKTEIFNFNIPDNLIAQYPSENRSESRLLIYKRDKDIITDSFTKNLSDFLDDSCFLVFNNSKVMPARIFIRNNRNVHSEMIVLKIKDEYRIEAILNKSGKFKEASDIILPDGKTVLIEASLSNGVKIVKSEEPLFTTKYLEKVGNIPIPPYIKRKVGEIDRERYQTIYGKYYGSSAAPTAGLHFDEYIFDSLREKNIDYSFISLHVGLGTFQPIYSENIEDYKIHQEEYFIEESASLKINNAIAEKKKIIPVGTTSLRTVESAFKDYGINPGKFKTSLFIYPPYNFKVTGGLFTNFHTPKSSLLVLVSALVGIDKLRELYDYAVKKEYRFFSYGDAMLIL